MTVKEWLMRTTYAMTCNNVVVWHSSHEIPFQAGVTLHVRLSWLKRRLPATFVAAKLNNLREEPACLVLGFQVHPSEVR